MSSLIITLWENPIILLNTDSIKKNPNELIAVSIDQCITQPSSKKLLLAYMASNTETPELDNMQRGRDYERFTLRGEIRIICHSHPRLSDLYGRLGRKTVRARDSR